MEALFLDTDICLDLLAERTPFYESAAKLFTLADKKKIKLFVSVLSFSNLHYLLSREFSAAESRKYLSKFKLLVNVLSVDDKIIELALHSPFKDFEDAIQYYTAVENRIKTIITRNTRDYRAATIAVMTAETFLKSR